MTMNVSKAPIVSSDVVTPDLSIAT